MRVPLKAKQDEMTINMVNYINNINEYLHLHRSNNKINYGGLHRPKSNSNWPHP